MGSPLSDFDILMIVKYDQNDYMLNNVKPTLLFKTEYNKIEIDV